LGSTANSLLFNDGTEFSAVNAEGKPLLTINAPIGLNFRDTPGDIVNQSKANDEGLGTTGTVGGDINLNVTDNIIASQASRISNRVNENAMGDAGDINIQTGSLTLTEESLFSNTTLFLLLLRNKKAEISRSMLIKFMGSIAIAFKFQRFNFSHISFPQTNRAAFDRHGTNAEVANTVVFLISEDAKFLRIAIEWSKLN
jgi:hypothetical protein